MGGPQPGQLLVWNDLPEFLVFQLFCQASGECRVAPVEEVGRQPDRLTLHQLRQGGFEGLELRACLGRLERVAPGAFDMPDHRQGSPARMAQQPTREGRDERVRGNLRASASPAGGGAMGEFIQFRGAGAVAGKVKRDHPRQRGIVGNIVGRKVMAGVDRLAPCPRSGPVLAEQGSLVRELPGVVLREAHPVAGGEQECRGLGPPEGLRQLRLGRLLGQQGADLPGGLRAGREFFLELFAEWCHEVLGAQLRGGVVGIPNAEEHRRAGDPHLPLLGANHAAGVVGILFEGVEVDASDGELQVKLVLRRVRDLLGAGDQQQVKRNPQFRIDRLRVIDVQSLHERRGVVLGTKAPGTGEFLVELRIDSGRLFLPPLEQFTQCLPPRVGFGGVGPGGEDDSPANLREVGSVQARHGGEDRFEPPGGLGLQTSEQVVIGRLAADEACQVDD